MTYHATSCGCFQWDLNACGHRWMVSLATSMSMIGYFCGCQLFGYLADMYVMITVVIVDIIITVVVAIVVFTVHNVCCL